ncbi:MarP family serine protease [Paramicrobacterium sp. CJ85]|uniref:MarP family serine protease n=1 Tax=Paramicrobacterium sp. CJ85 TaxID=3445355 RepID=UPI003F5ED0D5
MVSGIILDVIVVIAVIAALIGGWRRGLLRTAGSIIGLIIGGVVALLVMPVISGLVPAPGWNVILALVAGAFVIGLGISLGSWVGQSLARPLLKRSIGVVDRLLGTIASGIVAILVILGLAMSTSSLGIPVLTQAVASSNVLRGIQTITPTPLLSGLSQFRSIVMSDGIPAILDAAGLPSNVTVPDADTNTPALQRSSASVTRITANAPSCGTRSSGSGFVFDDGLIMTNAHVVAGATDIVVEPPGEIPRAASVVYFDPDADIAVLSADELSTPILPFAQNPDSGQTVFFQGYPFGGPFTTRSAAVVGTQSMSVNDIYEQHQVTRSVTTLAGHVEPGNSGGPLVNEDGAVVGMIFAKAQNHSDVGYALSMAELAPVIAAADTFQSAVPTGACSA